MGDTGLELLELILVESALRLLPHLQELFLPLSRDLVDFTLKLFLAHFGLLQVLRRNGGVETTGIFLGLQDHFALKVHELVETFELFDLKDEHVGLLLRLTELNRELPRIISCLNAQILQLALLLIEGKGELIEVVLELSVISTQSF